MAITNAIGGQADATYLASTQTIGNMRGLPRFSERPFSDPLPRTEGKYVDWQRLKHKIDQGADFGITQLFFDNRDCFALRDYRAGLGVTVPILPGIIPILSTAQLRRFIALCGAVLPKPLLTEFERRGDDEETVTAFGIEYATRQCEELLREGAPGIHF